MNTKICFVRHGRTDANVKMVIQGRIDNPLNNDGINDAHQLAEILKENHLQFDVVVASPLGRAKKTAQIILNDLNLSLAINENPLFIEREFGEADGLPINQANYRKIINDDFIGMETKKMICNRSKIALEWLLTEYPGKTILVVAHSHFIKSLFMQYLSDVKFDTNFGHLNPSYMIFDGKKNICSVFSTKKVNF